MFIICNPNTVLPKQNKNQIINKLTMALIDHVLIIYISLSISTKMIQKTTAKMMIELCYLIRYTYIFFLFKSDEEKKQVSF